MGWALRGKQYAVAAMCFRMQFEFGSHRSTIQGKVLLNKISLLIVRSKYLRVNLIVSDFDAIFRLHRLLFVVRVVGENTSQQSLLIVLEVRVLQKAWQIF